MSKKLKEKQKDYPPAQAPAPRIKKPKKGDNITITTILPASLMKQLRIKAARTNSTIRVEILKALQLAGYKINNSELIDRRKK